MSEPIPQDLEKGVNHQPTENEKPITEVDTTSSTTRNSTTQNESTDDPNIVFWDGPDDPESQSMLMNAGQSIAC